MNTKRFLSLLALVCGISIAAFAGNVLTYPDSPYELVSTPVADTPNKYILSICDTTTHNEIWAMEVKDLDWRMTRDKVVLFNYGYIKVLSLITGREIWCKDGKFNAVYPVYVNDKVLVAYKAPNTQLLRAYDLATGEIIWKKTLDNRYGWSYIEPINADSAWVAADDLYRMDWNTGKADKFKIKSGFADGKYAAKFILTSAMLGGMVSAATGGLFTVYTVPLPSRNTDAPTTLNTLMPVYPDNMNISGTVSNLLTNGPLHYIADRNNLSCFDDDMTLIWRYTFPERRGSRSHLIMGDGVVYMVNLGKAVRQGDPDYATGIPFVAAFNALNGVPYWYTELSEKKKAIQDYHFKGTDEIVVDLEDARVSVSLNDGSIR